MTAHETDLEKMQQDVLRLRQQAAEIEAKLLQEAARRPFSLTGFYTMYYMTTGFLLGLIAAAISLLFNIVGATIAGKSPLELIRIYLTFPLGERALQVTGPERVFAIDNGVVLAIGVCLYLGTGMLLGVPIHVILARTTAGRSTGVRIAVGILLGLAVWLVMFYGILSWLQPLVCGGNWITNNDYLPWWVAASTHAVFGASMGLLYPLGQFVPYRRLTESESTAT